METFRHSPTPSPQPSGQVIEPLARGDYPNRKLCQPAVASMTVLPPTPHEMSTNTNGPQSPAAVHSAEGAKNPWATSTLQNLNICTYNVRTLLGEEKLEEMLNQLEGFNWDVMGLSETRIRGEQYKVLKSGHILFTKGHENKSTHGVGFLIHKSLAGNVINTNGISERIIQISLKVSKRYILVLTQVYAPTTSYTDEEVDYFYEQVAQCLSN